MAKKQKVLRTPQPLSDSQWELMQSVWELGEAGVTEIWKHLGEHLARNTVLTQLDRLTKKGWLTRREVGNRHLYSAAVTREKTRRQHLRRWVASAFEGAADELVLTLLESEKLTADQCESIQQMIDQAKQRESEQGK
ncbi:MAG: BlaI/MecI/CopY family transcriptional regulator [Rubripirellula sp.]